MRLAPLAALTILGALALAACSGDTPEAPAATATSEATPAAAVPGRTVAATALDVPEGCSLFDTGWTQPPHIAGEPVHVDVESSPCGARALTGVSALVVNWRPRGSDTPVLTTTLVPGARGRWTGVVTFPLRGTWLADPRSGVGGFDVRAADGGGLLAPAAGLPLPALPRTVAILDAEGAAVVGEFTTDFGGIGLIRDPDRLVSVHPSADGQQVIATNLESGATEVLIEAEGFLNVAAAPDGSAVAISWTERGGRIHAVVIVEAATGRVTRFDDADGSSPGIVWAPDSSVLIVAGDRRRAIAPDGTVLLDTDLAPSENPAVLWAPDSSFALLRFWSNPVHVERLDATTWQSEAAFEAGPAIFLHDVAIAPRSDQIAVAWQRDAGGGPVHISVLPADSSGDRDLEDRVIATLEPAGTFAEFGGLSWSPDERSIAFMTSGLVIGDAPARTQPGNPDNANVGSAVGVIEVATGLARQVATSDEFYASYTHEPVWSADGSTLFALRFPCTGCGPPSSAIDAIDVAASRIIEAFENTAYLGRTADGRAQLLGIPDGLLRTDARGDRELLLATVGSTSPFGGNFATLDDRLTAIALAAPRQQILAAMPDGQALTVLGAPPQPTAVLLDVDTAIVRGPTGWAQQPLGGGPLRPYRGSENAPEKFALVLSPSGTFAIDLDYEGFAILDATRPDAAAILPRRPLPGATTSLPAWSSDEGQIAFIGDHALIVVDVESGNEQLFDLDALAPRLDLNDPFEQIWSLAWAPDGAVLFASTRALWRLDVGTGSVTRHAEAPQPGGFFQGTLLSYSPDGSTLAAATADGVFVLEADATWREIAAISLSQAGGSLRWSPDGTAIAYAGGFDSEPRGLLVTALDGSGTYRLAGSLSYVGVLDWLPDGRIVWFAQALGE